MTKSEKLAARLLMPINTSAILLLGVYTIVWGFWVGNPFWDVFTYSDLYRQMAVMAPEWVWGMVGMLTGGVTCWGVLRPSYYSLLTGAAVVGLFWLMITFLYFFGAWQSTGGPTALLLTIYGFFIYLNIKVNKSRLGMSRDEANEMLRKKNY